MSELQMEQGIMDRENSAAAKSANNEFHMTRIFDAPRDLVFKAWTERERLMHWWGPKGFALRACNIDLRPGGVFHYGMQAPDGSLMNRKSWASSSSSAGR